MGLEAAIKTACSSTDVTDIVGTRIRPIEQGPDDERPYLIYKVTGREADDTISDGPADYRKVEFEVAIYADDFDTTATLASLLFDRLADYGATAEGIELDTTFDSESDTEEVIPDGAEMPIYLRVQTYRGLFRAA